MSVSDNGLPFIPAVHGGAGAQLAPPAGPVMPPIPPPGVPPSSMVAPPPHHPSSLYGVAPPPPAATAAPVSSATAKLPVPPLATQTAPPYGLPPGPSWFPPAAYGAPMPYGVLPPAPGYGLPPYGLPPPPGSFGPMGYPPAVWPPPPPAPPLSAALAAPPPHASAPSPHTFTRVEGDGVSSHGMALHNNRHAPTTTSGSASGTPDQGSSSNDDAKQSPVEADGRKKQFDLAASNRAVSERRQIIVKFLTDDTNEPQFRTLFERHGAVENARIVFDRKTGHTKGFGFVTYHRSADAVAALHSMGGYRLHGRQLHVALVQTERKRAFAQCEFS